MGDAAVSDISAENWRRKIGINKTLSKIEVKLAPGKLSKRKRAESEELIEWSMQDTEPLLHPRTIEQDMEEYYAKPRLSGKLLEPTMAELMEEQEKRTLGGRQLDFFPEEINPWKWTC